MNPAPQQIQQQHLTAVHNANQLLNGLKTAAPHSQLTRKMQDNVRQLQGMVAQGKSTATIDAHLRTMHQDLQNAQKQAYSQHNMPTNQFGSASTAQPGHFGSAPMQQSGQYGYPQGHMGHYDHGQTTPTAGHLPAQNNGQSSSLPSAHSIGNADYMLRNMSKGLHGGYAKF